MTKSSARGARAILMAIGFTIAIFEAPPRAAGLGGQPPEPVTAIVGATVIDGNGGPPIKDATVLIKGARIQQVGPRATVVVPKEATTIDATGKFVTPGFVDTNVHISLYGGGAKDRK